MSDVNKTSDIVTSIINDDSDAAREIIQRADNILSLGNITDRTRDMVIAVRQDVLHIREILADNKELLSELQESSNILGRSHDELEITLKRLTEMIESHIGTGHVFTVRHLELLQLLSDEVLGVKKDGIEIRPGVASQMKHWIDAADWGKFFVVKILCPILFAIWVLIQFILPFIEFKVDAIQINKPNIYLPSEAAKKSPIR